VIGIIAVLVVAGLAIMLWRLVASQYAAQRNAGGAPVRPRPARKPRRAPMVPPDDDPEFLAELSRRTRRDDEQS
jgi:hypothetical protein